MGRSGTQPRESVFSIIKVEYSSTNMASAVPYNPDDFENNNPFAEPEDSIQPEVHEEEPEEEPHNEENTQHPKEEALGQLAKEELIKILPERFTNRYLIEIQLRSIEKNKPLNPILHFEALVKGLPKYRQRTYKDVRRTYNEVVKFNNYLIVSNLEVFVPVIPQPQTSYPTGGEDENKQLLSVWQEWFERVTKNPILVRDDEFVFFIENDFGYSVINTNRKSLVASGLVRKTLKQLSIPYDPYPELADFRPMIKSAYLLCQKLHKLLDRNMRNEKQLSLYISELGTKLRGLSQFETVHPGMKNMWEKLSKITQIQSDLTLIQLISDMGSLGDGTLALTNDFYEVKEALTNRHLIMRELIQAQAQTKAKHVQATKIKSRSSLDPIKVDEALRSLEYATKAEESLNMQVKRISGEMMVERKEVLDFTEHKFQRMLKQFSLSRVEQHRRLLKHLENIRLDIRIIDENGGLSRLNRDNLPQMKHNLTLSQAASGDTWSSRTFRSLTKEQAEKEDKVRKSETENGVDAKQAASMLGVATF